MPGADGRQAQGPLGDHRPADGAGPGRPAAPARRTPRRLREAGGPGSSLSLVRYKTNDYSAPVAYGRRDVPVRGYVGRVVISCGSEVIAKHPRSYERDDFVYDPIHYLPLPEQKTGAPDQAAPLQVRELPEVFDTLRRLLESRMGRRGKREFVQVLRLLETFRLEEVAHCREGRPRVGRHQLRCGEAPGAVPAGRDGRPGWTWNCIPTCHG